jgi:hypothetical protein
MNALHSTMNENGTIRNADGKLVGFYDRETKTLVVTCKTFDYHAETEVEAMALFAEIYPGE